MEHINCCDVEYRFGDYGPAYLMRGPRTGFGVFRLRPGDDMPNHYHAGLEESFFVIEGEATLWIDCKDRYTITEGDLYRAEPGELHYFVNESDAPFRGLFIKAPWDAEDTVQVPWVPGEPIPTI